MVDHALEATHHRDVMLVRDLGLLDYRLAWDIQEQCHAQSLAGGEETLLLVEHPPVITFGRRGESRGGLEHQVLAPRPVLEQLGVQVVQSDRGGETTFHGPGQLVAYPIIQLARHKLSVGSYMRLLQDVIVKTLADFGIPSHLEPGTVGVWVERSTRGSGFRVQGSDEDAESLRRRFVAKPETSNIEHPTSNIQQEENGDAASLSSSVLDPEPRDLTPSSAKIAALGVRIRRGVSLHGLALNVTTDLSYFNLINPCGLSRPVTSMREVLGGRTPGMAAVRDALARRLIAELPDKS